MRKSITVSLLRIAVIMAASLYGGIAWAEMTHDGADIQAFFAYTPGTTTDPNDPNWVTLVAFGKPGNVNPPSYSLSLP